MEVALVVTRLLQFLAVSIVGGSSLFCVYGYRPELGINWPFRLVRSASLIGVIGVVGWLMTQAAVLGEGPRDAFNLSQIWSVAADTGFGRAALVRLGLLLATLAISSAKLRAKPWGLLAGLGLLASASIAWTGHGSTDDGVKGVEHMLGDVIHLGAAGIWIGALVALVFVLSLNRARPQISADALAAFSRVGPLVVAAIVLSGLVNGWFLIGPAGLMTIPQTPYGRLLLLKLGLFTLMLGLAAANRYLLTPRLERVRSAGASPEASAARWSVSVESLLALAVLVLVSWLGTLSPMGDN